jgi:GT2 family glycosyltransferase
MDFMPLTEKTIDISIITINYNLSEEIENCLYSLLAVLDSQKSITYEIIIVDNNSPDKKLPYVEKKFYHNRIYFIIQKRTWDLDKEIILVFPRQLESIFVF